MLAVVLGGAFCFRALNLLLCNWPRFDAFFDIAKLDDGHQVDGVLQRAQIAHPPQAWIEAPGAVEKRSSKGFQAAGFCQVSGPGLEVLGVKP